MTAELPHVPLEAGAGPENPPCPACAEPLFPWVGMPVATGVAHRCEACGLGVLSHGERFSFGAGEAGATVGATVGRTSPGVPPVPPTTPPSESAGGYSFDPGTSEDALAELKLGLESDGSYFFDNRASLAGWLTGGAWVGLGTDRRYCFTPEAVIRLVAARDQIVTRTGWRPLRGIALMWQSGLNMFTFGQNVVLGARGKAFKVEADRRWKRGLDWFISAAVAIPAIIVAVPLELIAMLFRKGSAARAQVQVL